MLTIPNSWGVDLTEFNKNHDPADGRFSSGSGGSAAASGKKLGTREHPIQVEKVKDAIRLILQGHTVELPNVRKVNTVLSRLADMAKDAKKKGEAAPNYDLCQVAVPDTNLFCGNSLGIERVHMPQIGGIPVPGSPADKLMKDEKGKVNATDAFIDYLNHDLGITTSRDTVQAAKLKASQSQLVGPKVAKMMVSKHFDPKDRLIFISKDDYIVDGHHAWAAAVGRDSEDGHLGDVKMKTIRVNAPISEVLKIANAWTKKFGIAPKDTGKNS